MAKTKVDKAKEAADFEKIINNGRERKRNEALAASIFSKQRRLSAPTKAAPSPSLASRVGVKKRVASTTTRPAGNVNGEWTHDLHPTVSAPSLASRISAPGAKPRAAKRAAKLAGALQRTDGPSPPTGPRALAGIPTGPKNLHKNPHKNPNKAFEKAPEPEISIRGLAGPFSVLMQNFAPGTTAADIESVMTPVGGEMLVCRVVKTRPIMLAEMVFGSREAGDRVIAAFNGKTADGRVIKVYPNPQGYQPETVPRQEAMPAAQNQVVDGTMGFPEGSSDVSSGGYSGGGGGGGLYSDTLVARRGRAVRGDWSR